MHFFIGTPNHMTFISDYDHKVQRWRALYDIRPIIMTTRSRLGLLGICNSSPVTEIIIVALVARALLQFNVTLTNFYPTRVLRQPDEI